MPVRGIDFFYYPVHNMERAVTFYRDVLGLQPAEAYGDQWVEFNAGGVTVALDGSQEMPVAAGDAGLVRAWLLSLLNPAPAASPSSPIPKATPSSSTNATTERSASGRHQAQTCGCYPPA